MMMDGGPDVEGSLNQTTARPPTARTPGKGRKDRNRVHSIGWHQQRSDFGLAAAFVKGQSQFLREPHHARSAGDLMIT